MKLKLLLASFLVFIPSVYAYQDSSLSTPSTTPVQNQPAMMNDQGMNGHMNDQGQPMSAAMDDTAITAKVKTAFVKEKLFGKNEMSVSGIQVETKDGVVTLSGKVDTQTIADNAVRIAKSVDGVKDVTSMITIGK